MIDFKGLSAFIAVIENSSFERAANQLCITQSAVSQRLKHLEESIGKALVIRSPQIKATAAGHALLKYSHSLGQIERELIREIAPKQQLDWLKISIATNSDTLATWLLGTLAPWCTENKVLLDLKVDDQDQTHELLKTGEVLGCISSIEQASQGCVSESLGVVHYHCVVSPSFKKEYFSKGINKERFKKAPAVVFNQKDRLQSLYLQQYFDIDASQQLQHFIPSSEAYIEWIKLGMGFGMAPKMQVQQMLDSGELVLLTPDKPVAIALFWHQSRIKTLLSQSLSKQIVSAAKMAHAL
ncbi:LysR family transcriptional regulator ArgP [Marinomonas algicola]|uniref:LysR family transcriptional regulator ArgP n=1 Tax=Marinomonas algicola TaxID=2773454 RepID=UPI0017498075|nr:LysR family transcriptional regulator ArgP [Marinomonas algicola]